MLEQLYLYKVKYENEVAENEKALLLSKAKVSVVCDMIADAESAVSFNEETVETQTITDETY
jgi:hypothetical protein